MGLTACTEPQCLYKGDLYLYLTYFYIYEVTILVHCATSRKVAGSIPDGVTINFH